MWQGWKEYSQLCGLIVRCPSHRDTLTLRLQPSPVLSPRATGCFQLPGTYRCWLGYRALAFNPMLQGKSIKHDTGAKNGQSPSELHGAGRGQPIPTAPGALQSALDSCIEWPAGGNSARGFTWGQRDSKRRGEGKERGHRGDVAHRAEGFRWRKCLRHSSAIAQTPPWKEGVSPSRLTLLPRAVPRSTKNSSINCNTSAPG